MMCNKSKKLKSNNKKKKKQTTQVLARKCRTKTRKPKFLSLSKHIKSTTTTSSSSSSNIITKMTLRPQHHQLTLFPLHPENLTDDDRSFAAGDTVADLLFHSDSVPGESSLTGLLQTTTTTPLSSDDSLSFERVCEGNDNNNTNNNHNENDESLVRTAMKRRNSERDMSEEKWVCYSEVVEEVTSSTVSSSKDVVYSRKKKKKTVKAKGETTSSSVSQEGNSNSNSNSNSLSSTSLALKLDYQGILKAWSDKGSLYIQPPDLSPQTVPDLLYDHHGLMDGWGSSVGNLWKVPENDGIKIKEEMEGKDGWKLGQREASVLRYKEKRQSRLFAKRIRYEVRKLNAEKRPRMKGRFVKII